MRLSKRLSTVLLLVGVAGILSSGILQASPPSSSRFLVTATHTKEECLNALDEVKAVGTKLLDRCDWGCMAGDHTCYLILEGKNEASVKGMLPKSWANAKVVPLNKFTAAQIESFHKK